MTPIRLLVADDQAVFRRGLIGLLQDGDQYQLVGQAVDWEQVVRLVQKRQSDVLVVSSTLPTADLPRDIRRVLETDPGLRILVLTDSDQHQDLPSALGVGAHGHVSRAAPVEGLLQAIQRVHGGDTEPPPHTSPLEMHKGDLIHADRPSLLELVLDALRLPYPLSAALLATLFGPPGTVAAGLLVTTSVADTVELYFGGLPPETSWQQTVAILVWWLTYFVIFWSVRRERLAIQRESEALAGIIPAEVRRPGLAGLRKAAWPAVVVAVLLGAISWPFVVAVIGGPEDVRHPALGVVWVVQNVARLGLFFLGLGSLFWQTAVSLLGLAWLGRQPLRLVPVEDDALVGLRPAGSMALAAASTYIGVVTLLAVQLALAPAIGPFGPALAVSTLLGVILFFAPLWGLHRKMAANKKEQQAEVRGRLLRLALGDGHAAESSSDPRGAPDGGPGRSNLEASLLRTAEVLALEAAGRTLDDTPTWPFDLAILRRLGGAVMLPITIALLTELVRQVVGL